METLGELRQALQDDLSVEATDVFYTETILNRFINRAHRTLANLYPWQEVQKAKKRSTQAGQEYYDYWDDIRTDSVFLLKVDGKEHKKINFRELERLKESNPNSTDRYYSDFGRRLFIFPVPTTDGTDNVHAWGHETPGEMTDDTDKHIFYNQNVLSEALYMYSNGLALMKGRGSHYDRGKALISDAIAMSRNEWTSQQLRQSEYKNTETTAWEHLDIMQEDNGGYRRGNFSIRSY